ncbi:DNA-binding response regulator [Streptomyces nojiriensis]|uniref:DNA-binding response regulator n=1 Tax=Streptomyces nojiriensis TaxID=66374 RepID=A0ABQ3SPT6_9ACTN|nr:response regulator transcription factor [Streptomyces nojiriensis]QTI43661.1 Transcriptional regulatory protein KdpE [Streptomyces nojiriensis]GGR82648.1 DNA-binding response regulator [Streptomyces nojiriensis]GHI70126.1 DNA-binding response regulator [Streptomyces nojiriensis]
MTRVLVVDDEPQLARLLVINLKARKYDVDCAHDGGTALDAVAARCPDAVLLDLGLPDMDGIEVIKRLRVWSQVPVLVVSARHGSEEKIQALDAGADDYITKPFSMDELLARLKAVARRTLTQGSAAADAAVVETEEFTVDLLAKKARRGGESIRLTPTEWRLLEVLIRNRGRLVSQRRLLQEVWGSSCGTQTNYLRVYMAHLRRKLEADPSRPRHLITAPGMGYRFEA